MKRKNLLVLTTVLLTQATPVWAMDNNEDIGRTSANCRPAINSSDGDLTLQTSTIRSTGALVVQSSESLIEGADIRVGGNSIETSKISRSLIRSNGNLMISASDISFNNSTIRSRGELILRASGAITLGSNTSIESKLGQY